KISEWGWRAGVIRAASHKDTSHQDLQIYLTMTQGAYVQIHIICRIYEILALILISLLRA
ncbi:hypothetical protein L9F63_017022, partial [Diploptera punctata]